MDIEIKTTSIPLEVGVEKAGPQGLSAYEVAKKDGFVGTEQEWLASLKGEKGDIGETGPIGPAGPQGERGLTGEPGPKGDKGDVGETGATGQPGRDGTNGIDGISPTVSTSKSGTTTTIEITDKNGTHIATINDGINGTNGTNGRDGYVQYTAGDNITIEDNVISATGGDLSNYYTKSEIEDKYPIYMLNVPSNFATSPYESIYDANTLQKASDIINECYSKGYETCPLIVKHYKSSYANSGVLYTMPVTGKLNTQSTSYEFIANSSANGTSAIRNAMYIGRGIKIIGTWSNDVFTCSQIACYGGTYFTITNYLAKNNTSSYTPTANYHPATKKYVDDSIASLPTYSYDSTTNTLTITTT